MRKIISIFFVLITIGSGIVYAQKSPQSRETPDSASSKQANISTAKKIYSSAETKLGILMDDPAANSILRGRVPGIFGNPRLVNNEKVRDVTIKQLQPMVNGLTDELIEQIDADFQSLAGKNRK